MNSIRFHAAFRTLCLLVLVSFGVTIVVPPQSAQAQFVLNLPSVGTMVTPSAGYTPMIIRGVNIHPENPLQFDFIIDRGDSTLQDEFFRNETQKLVKYFLAALTVPEKQMWVNLSPYEKDRIIPEGFGATEMGRDLLAQDYMLKQLSASLMYPEDELGQKFWSRVKDKAMDRYGTNEIPLNTFNKIWIVPQEALVYEHTKGAFVVSSHLKVMLEEDYLALEANKNSTDHGLGSTQIKDLDVMTGVTAEVVREVLIPEIEREVNEGQTFSDLRQIYNAVILASWYKQALKESLLGQVYVDQQKILGIEIDDKGVNQKIYEQYLEAYKVGVYDYIKEEYDPAAQEIMPRKYFSGGAAINETSQVLNIAGQGSVNGDLISLASEDQRDVYDSALRIVQGDVVTVELYDADAAMVSEVFDESSFSDNFRDALESIRISLDDMSRSISDDGKLFNFKVLQDGLGEAIVSSYSSGQTQTERNYIDQVIFQHVRDEIFPRFEKTNNPLAKVLRSENELLLYFVLAESDVDYYIEFTEFLLRVAPEMSVLMLGIFGPRFRAESDGLDTDDIDFEHYALILKTSLDVYHFNKTFDGSSEELYTIAAAITSGLLTFPLDGIGDDSEVLRVRKPYFDMVQDWLNYLDKQETDVDYKKILLEVLDLGLSQKHDDRPLPLFILSHGDTDRREVFKKLVEYNAEVAPSEQISLMDYSASLENARLFLLGRSLLDKKYYSMIDQGISILRKKISQMFGADAAMTASDDNLEETVSRMTAGMLSKLALNEIKNTYRIEELKAKKAVYMEALRLEEELFEKKKKKAKDNEEIVRLEDEFRLFISKYLSIINNISYRIQLAAEVAGQIVGDNAQSDSVRMQLEADTYGFSTVEQYIQAMVKVRLDEYETQRFDAGMTAEEFYKLKFDQQRLYIESIETSKELRAFEAAVGNYNQIILKDILGKIKEYGPKQAVFKTDKDTGVILKEVIDWQEKYDQAQAWYGRTSFAILLRKEVLNLLEQEEIVSIEEDMTDIFSSLNLIDQYRVLRKIKSLDVLEELRLSYITQHENTIVYVIVEESLSVTRMAHRAVLENFDQRRKEIEKELLQGDSAMAAESEFQENYAKPTVLIVEDQLEIRQMSRMIFQAKGFTVIEASSLQEAKDQIENNQFDLIFSDNDLGVDIDGGVQLAQMVKDRGIDTKFVLVSGRIIGANDEIYSQKPGVDRTMAKPFLIAEVSNVIKEMLPEIDSAMIAGSQQKTLLAFAGSSIAFIGILSLFKEANRQQSFAFSPSLSSEEVVETLAGLDSQLEVSEDLDSRISTIEVIKDDSKVLKSKDKILRRFNSSLDHYPYDAPINGQFIFETGVDTQGNEFIKINTKSAAGDDVVYYETREGRRVDIVVHGKSYPVEDVQMAFSEIGYYLTQQLNPSLYEGKDAEEIRAYAESFSRIDRLWPLFSFSGLRQFEFFKASEYATFIKNLKDYHLYDVEVSYSDRAMTAEDDFTKGGIDLNSEINTMTIKRDGNGVVLPVSKDVIDHINVQGFVPVIINVVPVGNLPYLIGLVDKDQSEDQQRADNNQDSYTYNFKRNSFIFKLNERQNI